MQAVLALLILIPQDDVTRDQERVRAMLEKLRATMERIIEKASPEQADKLRAALKKLKLDGPEIHVDAVLAELKANRIENALREGQTVETLLQAILAILEDHTDPKTFEERAAKLASLLGQLREIRRDQERLRETPDAAKQRELAERTAELRRKIEGLESAGRALDRARDRMRGAADDLEQGKSARDDQDRALEELKRAEQELEDEIADLKRRADVERLVQLEAELKKAIERQERINAETKTLDKGALTRAEISRARTLGGLQSDLAAFLDEIKRKLGQENVEVFGWALDSAIGDMNESAKRLDDSDPGVRTQEIQDDAVRELRDLLAAFEQKRRESERRIADGRPRGGEPGKPPLVPDVVQLALMKKMQEALLTKTRAVRARGEFSDADRLLLRRLSDDQDRLRSVLEKYIEKFGRQARQEMSFQGDDDPLTPAETMRFLDEARKLMEKSSELLNDAKLFKAEKKQEETIARLEALIRRARSSSSSSAKGDPRDGDRRRMPRVGDRAPQPYEPDRRGESGSRFESRPDARGWGHLGPRTRESMLHSTRDLDQYPIEYREMLRLYFQTLAGGP